MTPRTSPPFRADHVGSLLRPAELTRARDEHAAGRLERRRAARRRGRRHPRRRAQAGGGRAAVGHRRRVPPRDVAHGLHRLARRHHPCRRAHQGRVPQRGRDDLLGADGDARLRARHAQGADLRRPLQLPAVVRDDRDAEADHPLPQHGPLPRRARGDRRHDLPRPRRLLVGPHHRLRRRGPGPRRPRLHLPAVRRHEPRLPQRPQAARLRHEHRRRPGAPARGLHPPHQRGARGPPRGHGGHRPPVPRQLPVLVGGPGRLRLRRRGAVQRPRRRRASSSSTTTRARAASSRCASCRRASTSSSAW